jgi:hypothetical protein
MHTTSKARRSEPLGRRGGVHSRGVDNFLPLPDPYPLNVFLAQ